MAPVRATASTTVAPLHPFRPNRVNAADRGVTSSAFIDRLLRFCWGKKKEGLSLYRFKHIKTQLLVLTAAEQILGSYSEAN